MNNIISDFLSIVISAGFISNLDSGIHSNLVVRSTLWYAYLADFAAGIHADDWPADLLLLTVEYNRRDWDIVTCNSQYLTGVCLNRNMT